MKHDPFDRRGYIYVKVDGQSGHYCKKSHPQYISRRKKDTEEINKRKH